MHGMMFFLVVLSVLVAADASSSPLTLMSNLAKQSETLAHGLKVANLYGNLGIGSRVGFAAYSTSNRGVSSSTNAKFPAVVTNYKNAYHTSTSEFRAPYDGMYIFSFSIRNYNSSHNFYPGIAVNGSIKMKTHCTDYSAYHSSCSMTVPLRLKVGDKVSIRSYRGTLYIGGTYSSFSGWRM